MKIVFDSEDFSENLVIGFRGRHQLPWIMIIKEYFDPSGNFLDAVCLWSSSRLWSWVLKRGANV